MIIPGEASTSAELRVYEDINSNLVRDTLVININLGNIAGSPFGIFNRKQVEDIITVMQYWLATGKVELE